MTLLAALIDTSQDDYASILSYLLTRVRDSKYDYPSTCDLRSIPIFNRGDSTGWENRITDLIALLNDVWPANGQRR
jgi:hypothetical protein